MDIKLQDHLSSDPESSSTILLKAGTTSTYQSWTAAKDSSLV